MPSQLSTFKTFFCKCFTYRFAALQNESCQEVGGRHECAQHLPFDLFVLSFRLRKLLVQSRRQVACSFSQQRRHSSPCLSRRHVPVRASGPSRKQKWPAASVRCRRNACSDCSAGSKLPPHLLASIALCRWSCLLIKGGRLLQTVQNRFRLKRLARSP